MTYEEKLQKIVEKLKDERDLTRKGSNTKTTFTDSSFTKIRIRVFSLFSLLGGVLSRTPQETIR